VGFGEILVEASWFLGSAVGEDPSAQGQQHISAGQGHTCPPTLSASAKQRGKELFQPPNWAFCP